MVAVTDICADDFHKLGNTGHGETPELSFVKCTEKAFHEIEPRGTGGNEGEIDTGCRLSQPRTLSCFCVA